MIRLVRLVDSTVLGREAAHLFMLDVEALPGVGADVAAPSRLAAF